MEASQLTELETVRGLVGATGLADGPHGTAAWCLDRLPALYDQFCRDYDVRYGDEIGRLVDAVLLAVPPAARGPITEHLRAMHARLGIPQVKFAAPKRPHKKAG
jgi:hypothetical protein